MQERYPTSDGGGGSKQGRGGRSPMEIETGMQPRNGAAISQGLLHVRKFSERKTADHFLELQKLRMEVDDAQYHADEYQKKYYDSTKRDENGST